LKMRVGPVRKYWGKEGDNSKGGGRRKKPAKGFERFKRKGEGKEG